MPDGLGARLREARQRRGLSVRALAQALGVSASMVSQVEMGKTQPSVATLYAMASYLDVSLGGLLVHEPHSDLHPLGAGRPSVKGAVQRGSDNPVIEMENGVRWERLASQPGGSCDPILATYEPGSCSSIEGKLMRHMGIEYAYLLEGELVLHLEFDTIVMSAGDSLSFDSQRPHMYSNQGETRARGIWFVANRREHGAQIPASYDAEARTRRTPASAVDVLRAIDELD